MRSTLRPVAAEFVGTFLFIFVGCGAVVVDAARGGLFGVGGIAFAHAFGLAIGVTMAMPISGGHLNPAVTFAVWAAGRIDLRRAVLYAVAQLAAAVAAVFVIKALFPGAGAASSLGVPRIAQDLTLTSAVFVEAAHVLPGQRGVGTGVSPHAPKVGGFAIGLTLIPAIFVGGPLTGAALNPARAFGPAMVALDWHGHLAYWIGPLLGAALAAFLWSKLLLPVAGDPEP
jgi:aquaporin Z